MGKTSLASITVYVICSVNIELFYTITMCHKTKKLICGACDQLYVQYAITTLYIYSTLDYYHICHFTLV